MKHTAGIWAIAGMLIAPLAHADVILHAFNWKYSEVTANADLIKSAGYKQVLISPTSQVIWQRVVGPLPAAGSAYCRLTPWQ